ncbi:UDP-glucuronosyltransferase 2C1-like [Acanthaster planci]|uniref:UDP-glucuronosyltransferase 2C1-like n=1 Tax=Acanthaster planci TaxID=133434 RepID=A0A8B7ZT37_ACAPL|nr:UDP-glucuronosyltransferase 2C1-like [Acanthaster planci]
MVASLHIPFICWVAVLFFVSTREWLHLSTYHLHLPCLQHASTEILAVMGKGVGLFVFLPVFACILGLTASGQNAVGDSTQDSSNSKRASAENDKVSREFKAGQFGSEITVNQNQLTPAADAASSQEKGAVTRANGTAKRILIIDCLMDGSHTHIQRLLARELASRGHNVTWLTAKVLLYWPTEEDKQLINFRTFDATMTREIQQKILDYWTRKSLNGEMASFSWYAKMWLGKSEDEVKYMFKNLENNLKSFFLGVDFDGLRAANFDVVLCEVMFPACSVVAHDVLQVPFINTVNGGFLGTRYSRWYNQSSPLSYVPEFVTGYTDSMTFPQRVKNLLVSAASMLIYNYALFAGVDRARAETGFDTRLGAREIMARSELFILNWDFHIEFPRPISPNTILIGGLTIGAPKPLPQDFETFIQGSGKQGVIIFSVSTLLHVMDMEMAEMIATALAKLPQRVIWKYLGDKRPASLGNNTMIAPWISQQDLIAHEKTRLLIYHGGLNGGYEAMYYGVPILGIPMFTDQVDDLVRLKYRVGMADYFPKGMRGLTSEQLYQGIRGVLDDPSYSENAKRASGKLRDHLSFSREIWPLAQTARRIESAIEHGTAHLRTNTESLAWYQQILVDVICIYISAIVASVFVLSKFACSCGSRTTPR